MKHILLVILLFVSFNAFSCSSKNQLTITINTVEKSNFPHKEYVSLGKKLFNDDLLSSELHSYSAQINHSSGTLIFDVASDKMKKQILTKVQKILAKQGLRETRVTLSELQKTQA
ncbi:hypothetical protein [Francisella adeliensis]|uniref:Uncharacterized protein n=1 Tax=Francisella adeliensis TaxID=2007306 RepID=A0A2Z4Y1D5_9GAMM|nr:hypothetical protein [Francisella adeliensis]AXA34542.1 hypothetical protein CDH04_09100 [Francisella adeliensis]MBK2086265.1 hypothetical protein [Francisella adeliensis]MBK2096482.1 hypothetical protein [Francisella adeliensis]QIW12789.1 hypothetical protein FZC43_09110 [Francisella adeliensis]QIW14667.1 hypothetical protein FZC44_09105 [Francisella adeliensis]